MGLNRDKECVRKIVIDRQTECERGGGPSLSLMADQDFLRIRAVGLNSPGPEIARGPGGAHLNWEGRI